MHRHNFYDSNISGSASGSEHSVDIGADLTWPDLLKKNASSKKHITSGLGRSILPDSPSPYPVMSSTDPPPEINDPKLFRPSFGRVKSNIIWQYFTIQGWLTKHIPPSYSFTKSRKLRYIVLADRMLYVFKNNQETPQYREFFELNKDTNVFVTDHFPGVLYCIEVIKRSPETKSWFLECSDADNMKMWLDRLKKTVAWLKENNDKDAIITQSKLEQVHLNEHDATVANAIAPSLTEAPVTVLPESQLINMITSPSSYDFASGRESYYSSSTGLISPKTPPLLADPLYYQSMMKVASANYHQQQQQQQHDHQTHPRHLNHISPLTGTSLHSLPQLPENLYYTNGYVEEWEPTQQQSVPQKQQQQQKYQQHQQQYQLHQQPQYIYSNRRGLSAPHVLPPQRPVPMRAPPPPPTPAPVLQYQQYQQRPPRSTYS